MTKFNHFSLSRRDFGTLALGGAALGFVGSLPLTTAEASARRQGIHVLVRGKVEIQTDGKLTGRLSKSLAQIRREKGFIGANCLYDRERQLLSFLSEWQSRSHFQRLTGPEPGNLPGDLHRIFTSPPITSFFERQLL